MPMYEYKCAHCGKTFEKIQKFSDAPLTVHDECGSGPVERLISAPALQFKGTGWYVTDYAKGGSGSNSGSDSKSKSESSSSDSSKSSDKKSDSNSGSGKSESNTKSDSSSSSTPSSSSSNTTKSD